MSWRYRQRNSQQSRISNFQQLQLERKQKQALLLDVILLSKNGFANHDAFQKKKTVNFMRKIPFLLKIAALAKSKFSMRHDSEIFGNPALELYKLSSCISNRCFCICMLRLRILPSPVVLPFRPFLTLRKRFSPSARTHQTQEESSTASRSSWLALSG